MKAQDPGAALAAGLADRKFSPMLMPYDPRRDDFRRRKHDAADRPFGTKQVPLAAARIDTVQVSAIMWCTALAEKPIRQAVARGNDRSLCAEQRDDALDHPRNRVRLQGDYHEILRTKPGGLVGTWKPLHVFFALDLQPKTVCADRRQMCPTRDETHVRAAACKLHGDIPADRACSKYAYPQAFSCRSAISLLATGKLCSRAENRCPPLSGGTGPRTGIVADKS